ncbi:FKBP-type peptidyl-prolyl cis-trans isomerase [Fragilaria crotonensis]|nr:FKBP-type peptidyl-prolyl cis-trans isomerase [Fragilaria crotonensis]
MSPFRCFVSAVVLSCLYAYNASGLSIGPVTKGLQVTGASLIPFVETKDRISLIRATTRRAAIIGLAGLLTVPSLASAAVTDETESYANTGFDSSYRDLKTDDSFERFAQRQAAATPSDEVTIYVPKSQLSKGLGLELGQVEFRTNTRVFVKSIVDGGLADVLGIRKGFIFVSVNGDSTERTNAQGVAIMVSQATKNTPADGAVELRFRDPSAFREQLLANVGTKGDVTTQVAPAGDTTQRNADGSVQGGQAVTAQENQRLTVTQLLPPKLCNRGATTDDLLEISYLGTVVDTGAVFDGSAIKINGEAVPGRGNDVTLYFVLGKQPFGQFPPGWDVGLEGMCVGERRRLIIPPVLAYGSTGVPRRGIPPDATLQYDITLISINGLATPQ